MSSAMLDTIRQQEETTVMTDEVRWLAVMERDRGYDGKFVLAVRSTGIYCRPSCPARKPRREQVTFFDTPDQARQAGFRACKRCCPDEQAFEASVTALVCRYIDAHLDDRLTLETLSEVAHLSPQHLQRLFKRATGISPREYADARRLEAFKSGLRQNGDVSRAIYEAGYSSSSRIYERSDAALGMTPAAYRDGGVGANVHYSIAPCALGYILVAATERGVCRVRMGDSPDVLAADLKREFPAASIGEDEGDLSMWVRALLDHLNGDLPHLELPLDIQATAFQRRVWQELQAIPYGETRSYRQIAEAVGSPKGARAVAGACAGNPVAVVIPCHRVVRGSGDLGGYRWGLERKQAILETEKRFAERLKNPS